MRRTTAPEQAGPAAVLTRPEILWLQELVRRVPVAPHVIEYAVRIVRASRPEDPSAPEIVRHYVGFGAGPRASQALILGAEGARGARGPLRGRDRRRARAVRADHAPPLGDELPRRGRRRAADPRARSDPRRSCVG